MPLILVIDDHELILEGTIEVLHREYPTAEIITAKSKKEAQSQLEKSIPDLVIIDLSLPEKIGTVSQIETGLDYLKYLLQSYPLLNVMVQSSYVNVLTRLRHDIDRHQGGFTIVDKGLPEREMLKRITWAMEGVTHTKDLKTGIEMKPEWLEVLKFAFDEGLQDKAIAKKMHISERMVRNYWTKLQDVLEIYPQENKNLRILTFKKARKEGLID